jgi:hypothetical protein
VRAGDSVLERCDVFQWRIAPPHPNKQRDYDPPKRFFPLKQTKKIELLIKGQKNGYLKSSEVQRTFGTRLNYFGIRLEHWRVRGATPTFPLFFLKRSLVRLLLGPSSKRMPIERNHPWQIFSKRGLLSVFIKFDSAFFDGDAHAKKSRMWLFNQLLSR